MINQQRLMDMELSLVKVIDKWLIEYNNNEDISCWISENLTYLMTKSAMCVLAGSIDLQDFLDKEGVNFGE